MSPERGRGADREPGRDRPADERVVEVGSARLAVRILAGDKTREPFVVLHGGVDAITTLRHFPHQLATLTGRTVIAYDRSGHGRSSPVTDPRPDDHRQLEADGVALLLDQLAIDRAVLVGHSDGGTIALLTAGRHKHRVSGVLALTPQVVNNPTVDSGIARVVATYPTSGLRAALHRHHGDAVDQVFGGWADVWQRDVFTAASVEDDLAAIDCAISVVSGHEDPYGWRDNAMLLAATVTAPFTLRALSGVGHTPHLEASAVSAGAAAELIADRPPTDSA